MCIVLTVIQRAVVGVSLCSSSHVRLLSFEVIDELPHVELVSRGCIQGHIKPSFGPSTLANHDLTTLFSGNYYSSPTPLCARNTSYSDFRQLLSPSQLRMEVIRTHLLYEYQGSGISITNNEQEQKQQ
jgi:hypothetical protein